MDDQIKKAKENKRNRMVALCAIAKKVCDLLDAEGVKQQEGCQVRQMAEQMWYQNNELGLANVAYDQPQATVTGGC